MAKINSTELAKIIAEETENVLLEEGIFGQMGANLMGKFQKARDSKKADKNLSAKVAAFINAADSSPEAKQFIMQTALGKELFGLREQYGEQQILQMMQQKNVATPAMLASFVNKMKEFASQSKEVANLMYMSGLSDGPNQPEKPVASQQRSQEEPTQVIPSQADQTQVNQTIKMASDDGPTKIAGAPTAVTSPAKQQIEDMVNKFQKGIFPNMKNVWIDQADQLIDKINNAGLSSEEAEKYKQIVNKKLEDVKAFPGQ